MMMEHIWIDCDPGIDDSVMLALAAAHRDVLCIHGISTVAGNQGSDLVTDNALRVARLAGMHDVPVVRGAREPLLRDAVTAAHVHGQNGLGDCVLPEADRQEEPRNAILMMRDAILSLPEGETMTLVPTGPMTNIALLLKVFPEVRRRIGRIVFMGGSGGAGNTTPYAEFNIFADPDAAQIMFAAHDIPMVMCGLDVTRKCGLLKTQIDAITGFGSPVQQALATMMQFYAHSKSYAKRDCVFIHDACTIMYLVHPELFAGRQVTVSVVRQGENMGQTLCKDGGNVLLLDQVNVDAFRQLLLSAITRA